ncbi:hypothetical protein IV102_17625 [bacterium]|nr:hypothetical protein [bacterium]
MKIQTHTNQPGTARSLPASPAKLDQDPAPGDSFKPQETPPEKTHTSWFHRGTGAVTGAVALAAVGVMLIGPLGNGMGGDGLIYPALGLLAGAGGGLIAGGLAAGSFHSNEQKTSAFHRTTAILGGVVLGGIAGALLLGPAGNGGGAEGLIYPAAGLAGGSLLGAVGLGIAAGHFPDRK